MTTSERLEKLVSLLHEIRSQLDQECCQTLMDADSLSAKIEKTLKEINS